MSWADPSRYLAQIFVEQSCLDNAYAQEIVQRAGLPWSAVTEEELVLPGQGEFAGELSAGKKILSLQRYKGKFFKPCPGTREYRCCGYHVLNTGMNCPIDCVYCILQAYLNNPYLSFFVNTEDLFTELSEALQAQPRQCFRIGTGEFTDSLALDRVTGLSKQLVPFFAGQKNAVLELKTKSAMVANLEELDHQQKTVVAWSLNSGVIMQRQEVRAATLAERLAAARRCADWGYRLAFHFDPLIFHANWQEEYRQTITALYRAVPAAAIAWISLGALRFLPRLKDIASQRFPHSTIYAHEFIDGLDGKRRYFRFSRAKLYRFVYQELLRHADPDTCIYFCMESDEMWHDVMGFVPEERGGITAMLDRAAFPGKFSSSAAVSGK